jgi:hypothetical protein
MPAVVAYVATRSAPPVIRMGLLGRRPVVMTVLSRVGGVYVGEDGASVSAAVVVVVDVGTGAVGVAAGTVVPVVVIVVEVVGTLGALGVITVCESTCVVPGVTGAAAGGSAKEKPATVRVVSIVAETTKSFWERIEILLVQDGGLRWPRRS